MPRPSIVQISPRMLASQRNGKKGGLATASKYGQDFRTERSERGGNKVKELYGADFYRHIRSLVKQKTGPKKKEPVNVLTNRNVSSNDATTVSR
jgi:hypothetical protein